MYGLRMTIGHYARLAFSYRWYVLVPAVLGLLGATVFAVAQRDVYQAETIIIGRLGDPTPGIVRFGQSATTRELMASLNERVFNYDSLAQLVVEMNLYPDVRETRGIEPAVKMLQRDLTVTRKSGSTALTLAFRYDRGERPNEIAAQVVNRVADDIREMQAVVMELEARTRTDFLRQQERELRAQLDTAERRLAEFRREHQGELPEDVAANRSQIAQAELRIDQLYQGIKQSEQAIDSLPGQELLLAIKIASPGASHGGDAEIAALDQLIRRMEEQAVVDSVKYTEDSETARRNRALIEEMKKRREELEAAQPEDRGPMLEDYYKFLLDQEKSKRALLEEGIEISKRRIGDAQAEIEAAKRRIETANRIHLDYVNLQREVEDVRSQRNGIQNTLNAAELSDDFRKEHPSAALEIAQRAFPTGKPVAPDRPRMVLIGLFAGLAAGVGLAFLRIKLDKSYDRSDELRMLMPGAILITLPDVKSIGVRAGGLVANTLGLLLVAAVAAACVGVLGIRDGWWGHPSMIEPLLNLHLG